MFGIVQEFITFRSKSLFKSNLERRGYYGNLEFNHEEEKLEMTVRTISPPVPYKLHTVLVGPGPLFCYSHFKTFFLSNFSLGIYQYTNIP